ncbi:MAG TPA: hypothetical protein VLV78_18230 [Thermoanaerobaculia bacterium]|nr:hypothetical protein [Thermoanaerobaculia bacterium]
MKVAAAFVVAVLAGTTLLAQSAEAIQKRLEAQAASLVAWTQDKSILDAVRAQNAKKLRLADIQRDDAAWMAGKNEELVKQMITGPCADHLRELARKGGDGESFVMDNQGALVCATEKTSDYWQGDEAKWIRAFNGGHGTTFIDRLRYDDSAKEHLAQISVPILDAGKTIGVITVGVLQKPAEAHH